MKEYNFDENKNMGETVRIDDIKTKLDELDNRDDYDDYDDYDDDDEYDCDDDYGQTAEVTPVRRETAKHGGGDSGHRKNGGNKTFLYIIAAAAMVAVVAAAVIFAMKGIGGTKEPDKNEQVSEAAEYFCGVVVSVSDDRFEITNTESGKTAFYTIDSTAEIIRTDGRKTVYSSIVRGDIINIGLSEDTGEVVKVEYTDDVWEKKNFADVEVDTAAGTISNGVTSYEYDKNTLFIYNGDFIKDEDLNKEDVVTLKGVGDTVWTVTVEKYHGFIELQNTDRVENLSVTVDGEKIKFENNRAAVSSGVHSLGISGDNIDTLNVDIHVPAGEVYSVDMASVQEKTGVLTLNVNVDNCIIVVDGKQVGKDTPVVLSMGSYPISVSAEGYKTYSGTVDIDEPLVEVDINMEKIEIKTASISVDSTPQGATVYANGAIIGVTPFTTQINYGDYDIAIKKEGYVDYNLSTTVNEEQKTISVLLTEQ